MEVQTVIWEGNEELFNRSWPAPLMLTITSGPPSSSLSSPVSGAVTLPSISFLSHTISWDTQYFITHSPAATKDTHQASTALIILAWFSQHKRIGSDYEGVSFSAEPVNVINRIVTFYNEFRIFNVIYFGGLRFITSFLVLPGLSSWPLFNLRSIYSKW